MNRDKVERDVKDRAGKTQQKKGKAADSSVGHARSVGKQSETKMQNASDYLREAFKNSRHS